ncbi:Protein ORF73 [Lentibacillus sp. JNUCC-1]|uniref:hypothetical protein n=1 Tax=Lentibacillus sp. JNUCC-1 TaxID=2654513 RepID=UPI0012E9469F|nr:hypothetical protein [Lentibacillus sp. JNUCC-1]MUV38963.1 Protein ORF73 [Lentibacillus sp. JNUCC-1]
MDVKKEAIGIAATLLLLIPLGVGGFWIFKSLTSAPVSSVTTDDAQIRAVALHHEHLSYLHMKPDAGENFYQTKEAMELAEIEDEIAAEEDMLSDDSDVEEVTEQKTYETTERTETTQPSYSSGSSTSKKPVNKTGNQNSGVSVETGGSNNQKVESDKPQKEKPDKDKQDPKPPKKEEDQQDPPDADKPEKPKPKPEKPPKEDPPSEEQPKDPKPENPGEGEGNDNSNGNDNANNNAS